LASGFTLELTDLAFARSGTLYGVSSNTLYRVDTLTAAATPLQIYDLGSFPGIGTFTAAVESPTGRLLVGTSTGYLIDVQLPSYSATVIGRLPNGLGVWGDLTYLPSGALYASALSGATGYLVRLDPTTLTAISTIPFSGMNGASLWGLLAAGDGVYVLGSDGATGRLGRLDLATGAITTLRTLSFGPGGAARVADRRDIGTSGRQVSTEHPDDVLSTLPAPLRSLAR
jgi:hypothetical protein